MGGCFYAIGPIRDTTGVTANKLVDQFVDLRLLKEVTGQQRNRRHRYEPYVALFESPTVMGE